MIFLQKTGLIFALLMTASCFQKAGKVPSSPQINDIKLVRNNDLIHQHKYGIFQVAKNLKHIAPWFQSLGSAVSVADINNDGYPDVYLSAATSPGKLLINNKKGKFLDQTEKWNLHKVSNLPIFGSLFFDCDQDGDQDLLMQTKVPSLYINEGSNFTPSPNNGGFPKSNYYTTAQNVFDYNNDGKLDVIYAQYYDQNIFDSPALENLMPGNWLNSRNKAKVFIFLNQGQCQFSKLDEKRTPKTNGWNFDITVHDFQGKGTRDLWFSTDFGQDNLFYQNENGYSDESKRISHDTYSRNGMGGSATYLKNQKNPIFHSSQIKAVNQKITGNLLWTKDSEGNFTEQSDEKGVNNCGWSWGSKFFDIDNDSDNDLIVANGFVSANPDKDYWYAMSTIDALPYEVASNAKNWVPLGDRSVAPYQQDCLYLNNKGRFKNTSSSIGIDPEKLDSTAVATIDYKNNGKLSFIIANQNGQFAFYENRTNNGNHWIGMNLIPKKKYTSTLGTKVTIFLKNGDVLRQEYYPTNGFMAQNDPRLHFGLGKNKIDYITFSWPSGTEQRIKGNDLSINQYQDILEI